jgi:hypothetical protein
LPRPIWHRIGEIAIVRRVVERADDSGFQVALL